MRTEPALSDMRGLNLLRHLSSPDHTAIDQAAADAGTLVALDALIELHDQDWQHDGLDHTHAPPEVEREEAG